MGAATRLDLGAIVHIRPDLAAAALVRAGSGRHNRGSVEEHRSRLGWEKDDRAPRRSLRGGSHAPCHVETGCSTGRPLRLGGDLLIVHLERKQSDS